MSIIYGNPLLIGEGGVKLNIDYGTNPPSDTTKLWVPRTTTPSSVEAKYEFKFGNEQLAVDNYNYIPTQDNSMYGSCQVGNYIYHYYWQSNSVAYFQRYDMNSGTWEKLEPFTSSTNESFTRLWQNSMLATEDKIYMFGGRYSSATYTTAVLEYDVSTNKITNISHAPSTMAFGVWVKAGDVAYGFACFNSGGHNRVAKYDFTTKETTEVSAEFTFDTTSTLPASREYYPFDAGNGIFYLLPLETSRTSDSNTPLLKVDLGAKTVTKYLTVANLFPVQTWISGSSTWNLNSFTFKTAGIVQVGSTGYIFGGQCANSGSVRSSPCVFKIDISSNGLVVSNLDMYLFPTMTSNGLYRAAGLLDNKIHIIQYYSQATDTTYRNNQTLTLYSPLDNNKLFLQIGFGNNKFNIVNDKKAKVEIAINNAFIGNSKNKADETDAFLYDTDDSIWKNIKNGSLYSPAKKGDIIKLNLDNTEDKYYRVLTNDGYIVEVVAMYTPDTTTNVWDNSDLGTTNTTVNLSSSVSVIKYTGSNLDNYLNNTWYNTLSSNAKAAIIDKDIVSDVWYNEDGFVSSPKGNPAYQSTQKSDDSKQYTISKYASATVPVGTRHIYALSVQDIIDYLSTERLRVDNSRILNYKNVYEMFCGGVDTIDTKNFWLRSPLADDVYKDNTKMLFLSINSGGIKLANAQLNVRPAFTIDINKISFTRV